MTDSITQKNSFDKLNLLSNLELRCYLDKKFNDEEIKIRYHAFLCGTLFQHSTHIKYSFKACEFLVYIPETNMLYHSEMNSEECFTNSLKWNYNFFKKIRLCLFEPEKTKNTYFTIVNISIDNSETKILNLESNSNNNNYNDYSNNQNEFELNCLESESKMFLEMHFIVDGKDITAFRLLLTKFLSDEPYITILNKALEFENEENDSITKKQEILYNKQKECEDFALEITKNEDSFKERKKQYLYKFYLLNEEKNKKLDDLREKLNFNNNFKQNNIQ